MDDDGDDQAIDPRRAMAGLGLLGLLTVALVGTIGYRIVVKGPTHRPVPVPTILANEIPGMPIEAAPLATDQLLAGPTESPPIEAPANPPSAEIPASAAIRVEPRVAEDAPDRGELEEAPRFIAPGDPSVNSPAAAPPGTPVLEIPESPVGQRSE